MVTLYIILKEENKFLGGGKLNIDFFYSVENSVKPVIKLILLLNLEEFHY